MISFTFSFFASLLKKKKKKKIFGFFYFPFFLPPSSEKKKSTPGNLYRPQWVTIHESNVESALLLAFISINFEMGKAFWWFVYYTWDFISIEYLCSHNLSHL